MGSFTKHIEKVFPFDGDTVAVKATRLNRGGLRKLQPLMKTDKKGNVAIDQTDAVLVLDLGAEIIKEHVIGMEGLRDSDGQPVSVDEMIDGTYHMDLSTTILGWIMEESFLTSEKK